MGGAQSETVTLIGAHPLILAEISGLTWQYRLKLCRHADQLCIPKLSDGQVVLQPRERTLCTLRHCLVDLESNAPGGMALAVEAGSDA